MKEFLFCALYFVLGVLELSAGTIRYEAPDAACPVVATGVELRGELDGSSARTWDTTLSADGWQILSSGGTRVNVLVLNEPAVVGGRLTNSERWGSDRLRVVRSDVIIPRGVVLTLGHGCVVKFLPCARFVVEDGGVLVAEGAVLADFADDMADGDTNYDADATKASGVEWWLDDPVVADLVTLEFWDGAAAVALKRTYTRGKQYGELPALTKEGAIFNGWYTEPNGKGIKLEPTSTASSAVSSVFADWTVKTLAVRPESMEVAAAGGVYSLEVLANAGWTADTDAAWINMSVASGRGNGPVKFSVDVNDSARTRVGTIRLVMDGNSEARDVTITQLAMSDLPAPVIVPADGATFSASAQRVVITCAESDATVRYTLDGSEPTSGSFVYTKSFNVFDTTTIKARAFKDGMLPSDVAIARILRLRTLSEAIDQPLWSVATDGDAGWFVDETVSKDGNCSARSGAIGDNQSSELMTMVEGSGTLSFWWRASCEDDPDFDAWDYLAVYVDNLDMGHIDGDSGWQQFSLKIRGDGQHVIKWIFKKDAVDEEVCENCAWVDRVSWMPVVGESGVPVSWMESQGLVGVGETAAVAANLDPDGDGFTTAEEYIIGTDPTDPDSKFMAVIKMVDGKPVVACEPDLLGERKYTKWGRNDLTNHDEEWREVKEGEEENYKFFKFSVEMK